MYVHNFLVDRGKGRVKEGRTAKGGGGGGRPTLATGGTANNAHDAVATMEIIIKPSTCNDLWLALASPRGEQ